MCISLTDFEFEVAAVSQQCVEDQLVDKYRNCSYARVIKAEMERITRAKDSNIRAKCHSITYNSSFFQQLHWVLWRTFWNLMLNPQTSVAQVPLRSYGYLDLTSVCLLIYCCFLNDLNVLFIIMILNVSPQNPQIK